MNASTLAPRGIRTLAAVAIAASALILTAGPAAGGANRIQFTGFGTFETVTGGVGVTGTVTEGKPIDGDYTGTLTADDGTLPDPGECEPAATTLRLDGPKGRFLDLAAPGEVCGKWTDTVMRVTHVFIGTFTVTNSAPPGYRRTDGHYQVRLTDDGRSTVFATDN